MSNFGPLRFAVGFVILVVFGVLVAPRPASAAGVTFTLDTTNLTVIEGNAITIQWTVTNNTGATIFGTDLGQFSIGFSFAFVSGDSSDDLRVDGLGGSCLGLTSLSNGSSCTTFITLKNLDIETENSDFAIDQGNASIAYVCPNCSGDTDPVVTANGQTFFEPVSANVQVEDVDAGATPEPSSLLLLGTGLLGLGPFVRRFMIS